MTSAFATAEALFWRGSKDRLNIRQLLVAAKSRNVELERMDVLSWLQDAARPAFPKIRCWMRSGIADHERWANVPHSLSLLTCRNLWRKATAGGHDPTAPVLGVLSKLPELRLGVLVLIERRNPGVECDALLCGFGGGHKGV